MIWMCSAVSNGAGFFSTHVLLSRGHVTPWPYVIVWAIVLSVNGVFIVALKGKSAGQPTFLEKQIMSIWTTCVVAMGLTAVINYFMGITTMLFMPAMASIIAAMTFSIMGALMGRWWYVPAVLWAATAIGMAFVPHLQFALFAVLWAATQGTGGFLLHRAKLRARAAGKR
jgi:hypothetical protein